MADKNSLSGEEKKELETVIEDLSLLFNKGEILPEEISDLLNKLKSEDARLYISYLAGGSEPEAALRDAFGAGKSSFMRYLLRNAPSPEVRVGGGSVDYIVRDELGRGIAIEIKPLFTAKVERDKAGRYRVKKVVQEKLNPNAHKDQILKYIRSGEAEYVILTNLREWLFFNRKAEFRFEPFFQADLDTFIREYDVVSNLREYLERKESESVRYGLDEEFFSSLRMWIDKLSEVRFTVDDRRKLELIIQLINKLIFIQTLDDHGVVEFNWIRRRWNEIVQKWLPKGKLKVLEEFLEEVDEWFFAYYDTELFRERILDYIDKGADNVEKLYNNLQLVIGLATWQGALSVKGILQYNFRYIDEDIFGKAYEMFLAEARKEEGIYYTPKYITQYIAENTVGKIFDSYLVEIEKKLENGDLDGARETLLKLTSIKVLDPACGSGSFLIKALRIIVNKYRKLKELIKEHEEKYSSNIGSLDKLLENKVKLQKLSEMKDIVGRSEREMISKAIVRHIHGVDLDRRALEVAKVNIWLEAIKLAPKEFRYDELPPDINHILPNLKMNLCNGNSLIGLPIELTIKRLIEGYKNDIKELHKLRIEYLEKPTKPELVEKIEEIKSRIRSDLNEKFKAYLREKRIAEEMADHTIPLYWPLEFWHVFFDNDGEPLDPQDTGFDVIIGNPPYGRIKQLIEDKSVKDAYSKYFDLVFRHQRGNYNYYKLFLERSFYLLRELGYFSMIFPTAFLGEQDSQPLRKLFFESCRVLKVLQFPEKTKVFGDVTQDVTILVYIKSRPEPDHAFEVKTNISREELGSLDKLSFLKLRVSEIKEITGEDYRIPLFIEPEIEWNVLKKISKIPPFRGDERIPKVGIVGEGHLHETHDKDFLSGTNTGDLVVKGIHLDQYFVNLDPEGPQPRWVRKNEFLRKKPEARENIGYERIIGRNTLNRAIRPRLRFTLLQPGIVITNAIKYIIPTDRSLDKHYIIGILNSTLLNWRFELFSTQNNIRNYEIEELPFYRADPETQLRIADHVKKVIELKRARYIWLKTWRRWCEKLAGSNGIPLNEVLVNDYKLVVNRRLDKAWTLDVTFYPTDEEKWKNVLEKKYSDFRVRGDPSSGRVTIYGVGDSSIGEPIYEMTFSSRDLAIHVYASIHDTLESGMRIENLSQLLAKTRIPIVKGINMSSRNLAEPIIGKIQRDLREHGIEKNIMEIDNDIEDTLAIIDAMVFKLYGLSETEIKAIFKALGTPATYRDTVYRDKVIEFYKSLAHRE